MSTDSRIPTVDPEASRNRRMGIKNLAPGLVERGKIKIGMKGQMRKSQRGNDFQAPQKLDHFLITTMERGSDNNFKRDEQLHGLLGNDPREIPVVLIYDDIDLNFQTRYASYNGRSLWCSGDGETARRMSKKAESGKPAEYKEGNCPCHRQAPDYTGKDKCKINGTLSVMIQGAEAIGGVWKFRTTSYNSVVGILSSLALIKRITGGPLAGIPLTMTLTPKAVADPVSGSQQTIYVVGLEYRGGMESLQETGHNLLLSRTTHSLRIEHIEDEAKQLINMNPSGFAAPDDVDDEVEEFYPETVAGELITADEDDDFSGKDAGGAASQEQGGGAAALNQAAMQTGQSQSQQKSVVSEQTHSADAGQAKNEPRVAGRLTYWIDQKAGDFKEIKKGQEVPDTGETVSRVKYEEFVSSISATPEASEEEPAIEQEEDSQSSSSASNAGSGNAIDLF